MEQDFLKYGDQICLYSDTAAGYLTTIGFNSPNLNIQQCSKLHSSHIPNIRNMVFEVVPKLGYNPMREYKREKKAQKNRQMSDQGKKQKDPQKAAEESQLYIEKFKMLKKRIAMQKVNNDSWIELQHGKMVNYGQQIQLRHVDSGMYLQNAKKTSDMDRQCQSIELTDNPSAQRVTFYIQQRYKYRMDGEAVVFNDHILLYNQKYNCYLHISEEYKNDQVVIVNKPSKYRPPSPLRRPDPQELFKKLEVNCSQNFYKWQVVNFRQDDQKEGIKYIHSGDVIRLKHAESGGYLTYDEFSENGTFHGRPCYIRAYRGTNPADAKTTNSLFEIEAHDDIKQETVQSEGMRLQWRMRGQFSFSQVRLRHLNSGKPLAIRMLDREKKQRDGNTKIEKCLHLTLGENLKADEINARLDRIQKIQNENIYNSNFNSKTDPEIIFLQRGFGNDQVFEIENTIAESVVNIKTASVVKLANRTFNTKLKRFEQLTISTEFGSNNDGEPNEEETGQGKDVDINQYMTDMGSEIGAMSGTPEQIADNLMTKRSEAPSFQAFVPKEEEVFETDKEKYTEMQFDHSDSLQQYQTRIVKGGSMDDVFIIEKVSAEELKPVLFIHSCIPKIKEFSNNLRFTTSGSLSSPYMKSFEDLLQGLVLFMLTPLVEDEPNVFECDGDPNQHAQKYLREIKIIDLLVDILIYPFAGEEGGDPMYKLEDLTQKSPITRICQLIYRLLKHCVKDNQYNKFYVAQWISHFFHQSMMCTDINNLKADGTISEILNNNKLLLEKQINDDVIENIVKTCASCPKNNRFLSLLSSLCICNGEQIGSNQDSVCEKLLKEEDYSDLMIKAKTVEENGVKIHKVIYDEPNEYENSPFEVEVEKLKDYFTENGDPRLYYYFESLVKLMSLMCLGRNYLGIRALQEPYSLNWCVDIFLNENVPFQLRSYMAKTVLSLHIDKDPLEVVALPTLTRVWKEIVDGNQGLRQVKIDPGLIQLKDFCVTFFSNMNGVQRSFHKELNELTSEVLFMLEKMIDLGFYQTEEELISVLLPLISLLDGSCDFTQPAEEQKFLAFKKKQEELANNPIKAKGALIEKYSPDKDARYRNDSQNRIIFIIKRKIIDILSMVINIQNDIRLTKFLTEFYVSDLKFCNNPALAGPEVCYLTNVINNQVNLELDDEIKKQVDDKVITWMKKSYSNTILDMKTQSTQQDIICILLDIILYQDSVLVNSAFTLLARYFQQKQNIIDYASQVQLLEEEQEINILKKCDHEIRIMKKTAEDGEFWMGQIEENDDVKEPLVTSRNFIKRLEMLTELCVYNPDRIVDKEEKKKEGGDEDEDAGFLNLTELRQEWDNEDPRIVIEEEKNDFKNQTLLRNLQAQQSALIIIKMKSLDDAPDANPYLRVLEKAYIFLIKFVRNNRENQKVLLPYIDDFIDDMEYGVHAFELVCEIFRNSDDLLNYPNLLKILKKAIKFIDHLHLETQKKTILLSFLSHFMIMNGTAIKENQIMVITELTSSIRKNSDHLFVGEQGLRDLDLYMLEMKNLYADFMKDDKFLQEIQIPPELSYTIEYINILATGGEGHNSTTEALASDRMPIDDLIANLRIADFCYPLKSALVYFMDSIYFDAEKETTDDNIVKMYEVVKMIKDDLTKFLEIEMRVTAAAKGATPAKRPINQTEEEQDPNDIVVEINNNFSMLTAFGSFQISELMEHYVFNVCFPALKNYLLCKLPIKSEQEDVYKNLFQLILKIISFAKKDKHFQNSGELLEIIKELPHLKKLGVDGMRNKQLEAYLEKTLKNSKSRLEKEDLMSGLPQMSKAQKLSAYLVSVNTSDNLIKEFEAEFGDIIQYITGIKAKSEQAFEGTNNIEVKELIESLIKVSDTDSTIEPNLRIVCLKVMRKVIEQSVPTADGPAAEWEQDDWDKYAEEVAEKQEMLTELGVIPLCCNLIAYETKKSIKEEALLVAIACLLGGNLSSQTSVQKYIRKNNDNIFICQLKEMLQAALFSIKNTQSLRNDLKLKLKSTQSKIQDLENLSTRTKLQKQELEKARSNRLIIEDQILTTEIDENEKPSSYTTNDLTVKRSIDNAIKILRFMQLLCENHNPQLQNILRQQNDESGKCRTNSVDFCQYLSKSLEQFQDQLNDQTMDVCNQLVGTLTEMIQGPCKDNQRALVNAKIIDSSREYISQFSSLESISHLGFTSVDDLDAIGELKFAVISMLTSLLEGEVDMEIINRMAGSLDFEMIKNRMVAIFERFAQQLEGDDNLKVSNVTIPKLNKNLKKDSFDGCIAEAFQIYILIHSLADSCEEANEQLARKTFNQDQWKAFDFIRNHTGRIEIYMYQILQRIYFPIKPVCHCLSRQARKDLMISADRESQTTKVTCLLEAVPDLIDEMNHNDELSNATIQITPARLTALKDFSSVVGMIMNLLYVYYATRVYHYKKLEITDWVVDQIGILGWVQGSSSFVLIFFFAINKMNLITKKAWREYVSANNEKDLKLITSDERLNVMEMSYEMTHQILMIKGPDAPEFQIEKDSPRNFGNWFTTSEYYMLNLLFFIKDDTFQYYVLYFGISVLGYMSSDIFYSFHLLDVITRSPVLQNVIKAVTINLEQVSMTCMLMMILVYIYTTLTFFYMQDGMQDYDINGYDSDFVGENNCLSMFQCFVTALDKGMRNGGGLGDITEPVQYLDETEKYLFKLVHDATFQIIINIICLNIIFGIIVNTFAQLRDEKSTNDNDMLNRCYICNFDRLMFDKNSEGGFDRHIQKDHYLWEYVYYIVYLDSKDSSDYDGVESFVKQSVDSSEGDISWVPRSKALCLMHVLEDDEQEVGDEMSIMMQGWMVRIKNIANILQDIQQKITKKEKMKEEEKKEKEAHLQKVKALNGGIGK